MHRKAQSNPAGYMPIVIISIIVLIIVGGAVIMFFDKNFGFFKFLPSFNDSKPAAIKSSIYAYDLQNESLAGGLYYFDGLELKPFTGEAKVGSLLVNSNDVKESFKKLYLATGARGEFVFSSRILLSSLGIETSSGGSSLGILIPVCHCINYLGNVELLLQGLNNGPVYGKFVFGLDETLKFFDSNSKEISLNKFCNAGDTCRNLKSALLEWRDAPINKPVNFVYYTDISSSAKDLVVKESSRWVCVEKTELKGKHYLQVDFNREVAENYVCS